MAALIGTLFATSLLDCLNPTAIAQQLLLQAALKKKSKVWFSFPECFSPISRWGWRSITARWSL